MKTIKVAACLLFLIQALILPVTAAPTPQAERPGGDQALAASWQSGPALPQALAALGAVVASDRLITLGGQNSTGSAGTPVDNVYKSAIGGGPPGAWSSGGSLDRKTAGQGVVLAGGRVYLVGGRSGDEAANDVRYALLDGLGNLSNWRQTESLPKKSSLAGVAVSGGVIYLAGGYDGGEAREEVYYSAIGVGGALGDWESAVSLPVALRSLTLTAANGYLYAIGGSSGSSASAQVYRAKINADASLGAWQTLGALPQARERHAAVVYGGRLVVLGGLNSSGSSTSTVYAAALNADGSLGAWQTGFLPSLPQALDRHAAVAANVPGCGEVIFVVGGRNGDAYQSTVYNTTCTGSAFRKTFVPLVQKGAAVPPEIYGRITQMGAGVQGVAVELQFYNGTEWSNLRQVTTTSGGNYSFTGVPALGSGQMYGVTFPNSESNATLLYYAQSFAITAFSGGRVSGGDLEVQNVTHVSPDNDATVSLPATFCWQPRGVSGDAYYFVLEDPNTSSSYWYAAGSSGCFQLDALPPDFPTGQVYHWSIGVENDPADNYEWGLSYYYRNVTFQGSGSGINGLVSYNGAPASAIDLHLRFFNGTSWSDAATTVTGADGRYQFLGASGLAAGQAYYVLFGPNTDLGYDHYLYSWAGPTITSYTAGAVLSGGDFDIANVDLLTPEHGVSRALPVTFTWQRRGLSGDTYRFVLFDPDTGDGWLFGDLGDVGTATLTGLPSGAVCGKIYGWYARVYHGADSYGTPFYYREITFSGCQATAPAGLPRPTVPADVLLSALHRGPPAQAGLRKDTMSDWMGHGTAARDKPTEMPPVDPW